MASLRQKLGQKIDAVGTKYNLGNYFGDTGLSELVYGGRTQNTGNAQLNPKTLPSAQVAYNSATYGQPVTGSLDQYYASPEVQQANQEEKLQASVFGKPAQGPSVSKSSTLQSVDPFQELIAAMSAGGSGGGAGAAKERSLTFSPASGRMFDLADPTQAAQYYQEANATNFGIADSNYQTATKNIGRSRDNLKYNTDQSLQEIQRQKQQLQADKDNYFASLEKQGRDLVTGKTLGDAQRGNFFGGLGANAFQSSQATSQDFADQQLATGLGENQKAGADATNLFATKGIGLDLSAQNISRQAGQDEESLAQSEADAKFARDSYVNENKSQLATGLAQAGSDAGYTDYSSKYKVDPYSSVNTYQPDLSGVSKYTSFQLPSASAPAGGATGSKFSTLTSSQISPQDNYFGYAPDEKTKGRISNYFAGKAA